MTRPRARRRIEIGWMEAIVLVFGYVLSLGVVGLGGVYVGQRAVQQRLGAKERVFRLPIDAGPGAPNPDVAAEEPDITFYEALGKGGAPAPEGRIILPGQAGERGPAAGKPPAAAPGGPKPPGTPAAAASAKGPEPAAPRQGGTSGLEQPQVVTTARPSSLPAAGVVSASPPNVPKPSAERPPAGMAPTPGLRTLPSLPADSRPAVRQPAAPTGIDRAEDAGEREAAPLARPPSRVTPEAAATARALLGSSSADPEVGTGSWSVQVNATQERGVADSLVSDLRARGYDAFIVTQTREGAVWYRVRVGRLASLEKANALVGELKERAGLSHAFVASD